MDHRCHFHEGIGQDLSNFIKRKVKGNHKAKKKKKGQGKSNQKGRYQDFGKVKNMRNKVRENHFPFSTSYGCHSPL